MRRLPSKLDVYVQARELARAVHQAAIGDAELRDRATRAAKSTLLNLAEGLPATNLGVRRRHFAIARNSLCEVAAAVDLAVANGALPEENAVVLVEGMQRVGSLVGGLRRGQRREPRPSPGGGGRNGLHQPTKGERLDSVGGPGILVTQTMARKQKNPRECVVLRASSADGTEVESQTIDVHEYYDDSCELIDSDEYRRARGIRLLRGLIYSPDGVLDEDFENRYDELGRLEYGRVVWADGKVDEKTHKPS